MDLLALSSLAPQFRLSLETSQLLAGHIFGLGLFLVAAAATAYAAREGSRAQALSAEVWRRRGLHAGPILITGVAEALADPERGATDEARGPLIELELEQAGTQQRSRNGHFVQWDEVSRSLRERPFCLRTDSGDRVRIETEGRIDLIDRLEAPERRAGQARRIRRARIDVGDRLWVRGVLDRRGAGADGPYRASGQTTGDVLRPPPRGALFVSSEPVQAEGLASARFHALFALLYLGLLGFAQLILFSDFRALRAHGVSGEASVVGGRTWITRSKSQVTQHYGWTLRYLDEAGTAHESEEETKGSAFYRAHPGDRVPIVYLPSAPKTMQLGRAEELGLSRVRPFVAGILFSLLLACHLVMSVARRPWWQRKSVRETERGLLWPPS